MAAPLQSAAAVPAVLDPTSSQHLWSICNAIQQSTQAPTNEIRKEAEASLRACEASAGFSDALLAIVSSDAPSAVRLVAVILLKGLVRGSWKATRGAAARVLSSEEKQRVREFLLGPVPRQEGDNGVAVQLAVLSSKVARHDWPREWPDLFPALLNIVLTPRPPDGGLEQRRALFVIHHVLKELETKRFGFDKPAFAVVVSNHFKAVRQLYSTLAPAQLSEGIARVQLVTLLVKVMYRMVLLGMPQLQLQEGRVWLGQLVEHMQTIINALLQQRGQMGTDLVTALEKQLKRCALVLKDAQHDHAIAFAPFLPNALVFFHDTLLAVVDAAPSRDSVVAVQFAIQSVVFLSNVVGCSSYRADTLQSAVAKGKMAGSAGGDSPINAETATAIRQALDAFWTPARISQLCEWTIRHLLPLSPSDLQYWSDDPEAFVLEQDSLDVTESLRVAGEHLFLGMVESPDHGRQVVGIVEDMLTASAPQQLEAFATTSGITDTVFLVDALYLAVGLATMSLSGDMLRIWVQEVLGPGTRRMLAATTAPPLLLRRALWAVGCVANHLTAPIAADVASLVAAVLGGGAAQGDAAVQLAALSTLHGIVEQWVYDPSEALVPALGPLLDGLFSVLGRMRELEPRQQVLDALVAVIEIVSTALLPFANKLLEVMPLVWSAAEEQTPLRITCLTLMAQIVLAVGTTPGAAQALAPVVVPMIALACHVDARDADAYMITGGMELWLQYTRRCPAYTAELHALFLLLAGVLERDMECVKTGMLLLEAYALLGQQAMLSAYAEHVVRSLQTCAAQVKPDGAQFVTRALEAILNVAPREGAALLLPVLERLLVSVLASARGESSCEPDIVIVQHVTVLAHVLLAAPDVCAELLRRCSVGVVDLAHVMVHLFDAVGGGTPHRRRSWCLALLACLPQLRPEQVQELMDQVVNICVSALNDEECKSPVAGQSTHGGAGEDYGGLVIRLGIDSDQYRPLLLLPQQPHHTESVDLRQSIQRCMDQCSSSMGSAAFNASMETVEPVLLQQLQSKLTGPPHSAQPHS